MNKAKKRKNEGELIKFVWSRRKEYDIAVLQEAQARNPYSFHKPKPIWDDIAKTLREGDLKMKVSGRSCRERVNDLLKKYRQKEGVIRRSTGATDDGESEITTLLEIVSEMASTKPAAKEAVIYSTKKKSDGDKIRDAVRAQLSDSDSDDYIHDKDSPSTSGKKSRNNEEAEVVTSVNDFFNDRPMSLEEEERMYEEQERMYEEAESDYVSFLVDEETTIPSTSRDNAVSIRDTVTPSATSSQSLDLPCQQPLSQPVVQQPLSQPVVQQTTSASVIQQTTTPSRVQQSSQSVLQRSTTSVIRRSTALGNSPLNTSHVITNSTNNRFSNPKKDLICFLEKKAEIEMELHKEEICLREAELSNKTEELRILRLKAEAEVEGKKIAMQLEADNKKEELSILRLKTEAEAEERRKTQELLISLLTKKN